MQPAAASVRCHPVPCVPFSSLTSSGPTTSSKPALFQLPSTTLHKHLSVKSSRTRGRSYAFIQFSRGGLDRAGFLSVRLVGTQTWMFARALATPVLEREHLVRFMSSRILCSGSETV
jgi:hypothetical protein